MYSIFAICQGEREVEGYRILPFPAKPGPTVRIGYYMWCIQGEGSTVLVDTGMSDEEAAKRNLKGSEFLSDSLAKLGVNPVNVEKIILTHLHHDHFSGYQLFPRATFHLQRKEVEFLTGPGICFRQVTELAPHMSQVLGLAYERRLRYLDGDEHIAPGIRVVLVGGHTPGSQIVVVNTAKGDIVLCSDAADLYRNFDERIVAIGVNMLDGLLALDKIKNIASRPELIVPSHDPLVLKRFPNPFEGVAQIA